MSERIEKTGRQSKYEQKKFAARRINRTIAVNKNCIETICVSYL